MNFGFKKIQGCKIINLPKIFDPRGNLTFIEALIHIPFNIKRVYWIYDVPGGEKRGGHAFKNQEEFIVSLSGSFDIVLDNGKEKVKCCLNRSYYGLYVTTGVWRHMENFSTNALALVLASTNFNEDDYIRDYEEYRSFNIPNEINDKLKENKIDQFINKKGKCNIVDDCQLLDLDRNHRVKGNITVIENRKLIPFDIERVYYLYDVPGGEERGGHAHKELSQLIIAAGGSFEVLLNDGRKKHCVTLNHPYQGLYIIPGIWRELINFSSGSTCLVLASQKYDEHDYLRNYNEFLDYKHLGE
jgi:uncharacterized cupin superfamily protein